MAWRTVLISSPARLRIDNDRLVVIQDEEIPLPLEDIAVLMLETAQVSLSAAVLARLAERGAAVIVCGPNHLPLAQMTPFAGHSRASGVQRIQLAAGVPFRKRCWQSVVRAKILNQARCLKLLGRDGADAVAALAGRVTSGDTTNVESAAAREYFRRLFGGDFSRGAEDGANAALNYGYAVLRAGVARSLAAHGFILTQGIHHHSELNPFNLADDFLEPLRPCADLMAASFSPAPDTLDKEHRAALAGLLGAEVAVNGQAQSVMYAIDLMCASFGTALRAGDARLLKLPELLPLAAHEYE